MSGWLEVVARLENVPEDWSPFADAFDRHGCPSTMQSDEAATITGCLPDVAGADSQAEKLAQDLRAMGAVVGVSRVPDQDWSELWKIHFKPRRVGRRIVIQPSWDQSGSEPDDVVIVLDPGQAFGTGDHPTTRLCLELMEGLDLQGKRVVDIGCGSGVLGIAAAKLGAAAVLASDLDPVSVEVARANAAANQVSMDLIVEAGMGWLDDPAEIMLSNLISATLIRLAGEASQAVRGDGLWVVSGIIEDNWPDVEAAAFRVGFRLEQSVREDGWVAAVFRREENS